MDDQRFPREHRIRSNRDFQRAYRRGSRASDSWLLVFGHGNGLSCSRLGLSISRKVGPAVVRNRWKRLVREAFRRLRPQLPAGIDFVVVARRGSQLRLAQARVSLAELAARAAARLGGPWKNTNSPVPVRESAGEASGTQRNDLSTEG